MPAPRTAAKATALAGVALVSIVLALGSALVVVPGLDRPAASAEDVGEPRYCAATTCNWEMSSDARSVVDALERRGLDCRATPRLTDEVVVEWGDGRAESITFARALEVSVQRDGWLRSFCGSPAPSS